MLAICGIRLMMFFIFFIKHISEPLVVIIQKFKSQKSSDIMVTKGSIIFKLLNFIFGWLNWIITLSQITKPNFFVYLRYLINHSFSFYFMLWVSHVLGIHNEIEKMEGAV